MKTIVLTGMMGSGKTTVAKLLAQELNLEMIDIDSLIEQNEKLSIAEIFTQKGEIYFRQIEKQTIENILKSENQIISLGGGSIENQQTREFLLNNSKLIYLETSPETIFNRIKNNTTRPLLCGNMSIEKISEILTKRESNYISAHIKITTDNKSPNEVTREILGVLKV